MADSDQELKNARRWVWAVTIAALIVFVIGVRSSPPVVFFPASPPTTEQEKTPAPTPEQPPPTQSEERPQTWPLWFLVR